MLPLVDIHCHLLAGLDDGPKTPEEALEMCRMAYADGVRYASAGAHQNPRYPDNNPERLRSATRELDGRLAAEGIALNVFANAEVEVQTDTAASYSRGEILSVADGGKYILLEMPHGVFVDLRGVVRQLRAAGVRTIVAHAERCPELLHNLDRVEELIYLGCLIQVSSSSITAPRRKEDHTALKDWVVRGLAHLLASDGHSTGRRPPLMGEAYRTIAGWAGADVADRLGSTHGLAVIRGESFQVPPIVPKKRRWWFLPW